MIWGHVTRFTYKSDALVRHNIHDCCYTVVEYKSDLTSVLHWLMRMWDLSAVAIAGMDVLMLLEARPDVHIVSNTTQRHGSRFYTNWNNGKAHYFDPYDHIRLTFSEVATLGIRTRYKVHIYVGCTSESQYTACLLSYTKSLSCVIMIWGVRHMVHIEVGCTSKWQYTACLLSYTKSLSCVIIIWGARQMVHT